jgi:tRNA(Arg) A34 adenosine deaminase TadA
MADLRTEPTLEQMLAHLRAANAVARRAREAGHHPFGAILVAADHETVLLEQGNLDTVNHAEATMARTAAARYPAAELWDCTLYSTFEPCAMCAGTMYWAHIGRLVYGATEERLLALTGGHAENPTLAVPCRFIFDRGQKAIRVYGPFAELEDELVAPHVDFWR